MIHPYDPQAAMNAKYAAFARENAAQRASQAATGPHSPGCDSRAASDPGGGSAGHTGARTVAKKRILEALERWHEVGLFETSGEFAGVMEAVDDYATAIRAAIADEIEAEEAKIDRRSSDQASWHSNGMIAAANLIRGAGQ